MTTTTCGATATVWRVLCALTGAFAITGVAGGCEAIAGVTGGGATIGGAWRGAGTILRGSGRAGGAGTAAAAGRGGGVFATTAAGGFTGRRLRRASSSSSFFLARTAFRASPGLEICDRSILGVIVCPCETRDPVAPAEPADRPPCSKCARTLATSPSSSELEWVLPAARPNSPNTSRISRLLTSNSRARSLIRTLLIRLFSKFASKAFSCS